MSTALRNSEIPSFHFDVQDLGQTSTLRVNCFFFFLFFFNWVLYWLTIPFGSICKV